MQGNLFSCNYRPVSQTPVLTGMLLTHISVLAGELTRECVFLFYKYKCEFRQNITVTGFCNAIL